MQAIHSFDDPQKRYHPSIREVDNNVYAITLTGSKTENT